MLEAKAMKIAFFTDGPPFDGLSLAEGALGGSETALVQAAEALAARGHSVDVFNNCPRPGLTRGVRYRSAPEYPGAVRSELFDVFIVSRFFGFFRAPIPASLKILWNHDTLDRPDELRQVLPRIDLMFNLSAFHRDNYLTRIPELSDRVFVTRNGLDFALLDKARAQAVRDPAKVIYASRPERGLKILLEDIWPRLIRERPELHLCLCGYEVKPANLAPGLSELYRYLDALIEATPNVTHLGALSKTEYYRHLSEAALMLYPCSFPEISCIAALEAQACRTPILTTDGFALSETVQLPEFRVPGRAGTESYNKEYLRRALNLLADRETAAVLAEKARLAVEQRYSWTVIAAEWERLFRLHLVSLKQEKQKSGDNGQRDGRLALS